MNHANSKKTRQPYQCRSGPILSRPNFHSKVSDQIREAPNTPSLLQRQQSNAEYWERMITFTMVSWLRAFIGFISHWKSHRTRLHQKTGSAPGSSGINCQ